MLLKIEVGYGINEDYTHSEAELNFNFFDKKMKKTYLAMVERRKTLAKIATDKSRWGP